MIAPRAFATDEEALSAAAYAVMLVGSILFILYLLRFEIAFKADFWVLFCGVVLQRNQSRMVLYHKVWGVVNGFVEKITDECGECGGAHRRRCKCKKGL